ncbi:hypothetical protein [Pseudomonas oryzihabitans]|uniref:hypothetical protein n=1 Tax=Pseudomonas oryzihabitans TaxID=47885 RepID=UPI001682D167|nr:hypothetical protein [Pseudomonas oryzihabitans]
MARTLLESVCKHILDEAGESEHEAKPDLNKLYKKTAGTRALELDVCRVAVQW